MPLDRRSAWRFDVEHPTVVLGSTQGEGWVNPEAIDRYGLDVVVRRSGGGLVVLIPGEHVWIDVVVPRGDTFWTDDVSLSFDWLGRVWAQCFAEVIGGDSAPLVHSGRSEFIEEGRAVCHAGVGSGEVFVDGRKAVGFSQRRSRDGARFQCVMFSRFDPELALELVLPSHRTDRLRSRLSEAAYETAGATAVGDAVLSALSRHPD